MRGAFGGGGRQSGGRGVEGRQPTMLFPESMIASQISGHQRVTEWLLGFRLH